MDVFGEVGWHGHVTVSVIYSQGPSIDDCSKSVDVLDRILKRIGFVVTCPTCILSTKHVSSPPNPRMYAAPQALDVALSLEQSS